MNNYSGKPGEKQLIKSLGNQERDAYKYVLDQYRESIVRVCRGFLHSREDAEDAAQEVFIKLFKSAGSFRGDAKLSTWLYRVAVNTSINYLRSAKTNMRVAQSSIDNVTNLESSDKSDRSLTNMEHSKALKNALDKLPENQKSAFILNKYDDLSYIEVSEIMEISLSSVQSLIFRARKNLQDSLREYFENNVL